MTHCTPSPSTAGHRPTAIQDLDDVGTISRLGSLGLTVGNDAVALAQQRSPWQDAPSDDICIISCLVYTSSICLTLPTHIAQSQLGKWDATHV
jgi:hypothetical protein